MATKRPIGVITRGTTNPNRLRRVDRFICNQNIIKSGQPLVVDLGYGASPTTTIELKHRLQEVNPKTIVLGIEIDRERVERAVPFESADLKFSFGGFELPIPASLKRDKVSLIRAMNVLRQYREEEVLGAWSLMQQSLEPGGLIIEGTCDEIGRLASWITLDSSGPVSLTLSYKLTALIKPSKIAERLPKALIHRNIPGEKIHDFLNDLETAWHNHAGLGVFSPVQRFVASCHELGSSWNISKDPKRWKLGELTIAWADIKPQVTQP